MEKNLSFCASHSSVFGLCGFAQPELTSQQVHGAAIGTAKPEGGRGTSSDLHLGKKYGLVQYEGKNKHLKIRLKSSPRCWSGFSQG